MGRISKTPLAVLAAGAVLTLSIVSPALGGPSIGSVAKTAKKALSTGKKAMSRARAADRRARAPATVRAAPSSALPGPPGWRPRPTARPTRRWPGRW